LGFASIYPLIVARDLLANQLVANAEILVKQVIAP